MVKKDLPVTVGILVGKNKSKKDSTNSHIYRSQRDIFFILLAFFLFFFILALPKPVDLTLHGQRSLAIFTLALTLWVTNALPLSVTGLLVIAMIPLLQIMEADRAYSFFGNHAVFFILGAFIMATAMMKSGLSKRMALGILHRFSRNPRILVLGILITCSSLSLIMPEHAVAALMFPVVSTITLSLNLEPSDIQYGAGLFLAMSWGAVIGGIGTLLGGARAPLAIGLLQEGFGQTITFWGWSKVSLPLAGLMLVAAFLVLILCFHMKVADVTPAMKRLEEELLEIGPMTRQEKRVLCITAVTILIWIFFNQVFGLALVSLLSAVTLFVARTITWDDVDSYVNWGVILMYGGAIVLAKAVDQTGAAHWIARRMLGQTEFHPFWILAILALISLMVTEGISNVACVAILLPIGFSLARAKAINPLAMTFSIAIPSGLALILPMGTPSNAIAYSSGFYEIREILKAGLILHICGWIIFLILVKWYWPLVGVGLLLK